MIARSKPMRRVSPKKKARSGKPGKLGIVRLYGRALAKLREQCWDRDKGICQATGEKLYWEARFPGDPLAYDMAHIKSRGAGGSDILENVRALSHEAHLREHGGKH